MDRSWLFSLPNHPLTIAVRDTRAEHVPDHGCAFAVDDRDGDSETSHTAARAGGAFGRPEHLRLNRNHNPDGVIDDDQDAVEPVDWLTPMM
jgi:hypothetical protein